MSKLAVVTGASRRVGRATAIALAERGFHLALTCKTRAEDLAQTAAMAVEAAAHAGHTIQVRQDQLDMADSAAVERYTRTMQGAVDVVVLNASRYVPGELGSVTGEEMHADYQVNAVAPLLLVQGLRGGLERSALDGGGAVVALGDMHADGRPLGRYASYLMSKAALHQMVQVLALALAPRVRVNGVLPGVVAWPEGADPAFVARYEARIPLARAGTPQDAARAICAVALDMPYLTGALLHLDGGRWLT